MKEKLCITLESKEMEILKELAVIERGNKSHVIGKLILKQEIQK